MQFLSSASKELSKFSEDTKNTHDLLQILSQEKSIGTAYEPVFHSETCDTKRPVVVGRWSQLSFWRENDHFR